MSTVKILAIGNSFSQDATRYLHQTALAAGVDTKIVNLYIGGCPLERHWKNIETDERAYGYQLNGVITERSASISEVLAEESWDYITLQQASHDSGWLVSYEPFLGLILAYLKEKAPSAKILMHETWAYDIGSSHGSFMRYNRDQAEMFEKLHACYTQMAEKYGLELIPAGEVIQKVRSLPEFDVAKGGQTLCRDGFHMGHDYGRYLLALVWTRKLLQVSVKDNTFVPDSLCIKEAPQENLLQILRDAADQWV